MLLYKLFIVYQPGGLQERQTILRKLQSPETGTSFSDALQILRQWLRLQLRAQELRVALPDVFIMVQSLDTILQTVASLDAQMSFRLSTTRMELQLDTNPTLGNLAIFAKAVQAELELRSVRVAVNSDAEGKGKAALKVLDANPARTVLSLQMQLETERVILHADRS